MFPSWLRIPVFLNHDVHINVIILRCGNLSDTDTGIVNIWQDVTSQNDWINTQVMSWLRKGHFSLLYLSFVKIKLQTLNYDVVTVYEISLFSSLIQLKANIKCKFWDIKRRLVNIIIQYLLTRKQKISCLLYRAIF